jgi:hypothetical protein
MSGLLKLNKNITSSLDDYVKYLYKKCDPTNEPTKCDSHNVKIKKSTSKITDENIVFPTIYNYKDIMFNYNHNVSSLKTIAKHYKLKITGNKSELFQRIHCFLHLSLYAIKLQKIFRGFLRRRYNFLHGPAYKNRKICTNNTDFVTMEPVEDIGLDQFISFEDVDKFIYGFDISSLYNMVVKHKETKNPYNRNNIPDFVLKNIKKIVRFSKILGLDINLSIENDIQNVSDEKNIELRALSLFQNIDSLGNYSNPQWFLSLTRNNLIKFIRELIDIWNYRAQLTMEVKRNICPPVGDPFQNVSMYYIQTEQNINNIKKVILNVLERLVNNGIDRDNKSLGAYYVLGALTLVNNSAATALPWLYQSVCYFN